MAVGAYSVTYDHFREDHTPAMETYEARLLVTRDGTPVGTLTPQKRMYRNFSQSFAEVSVIPSLGEEIYATLLGFNEDHDVSIKVSINPLVNWIWIGGTLMCLAAFLCWRTGRRKG
jgi:cytochrome c-type biogenesis protein CcmF